MTALCSFLLWTSPSWSQNLSVADRAALDAYIKTKTPAAPSGPPSPGEMRVLMGVEDHVRSRLQLGQKKFESIRATIDKLVRQRNENLKWFEGGITVLTAREAKDPSDPYKNPNFIKLRWGELKNLCCEAATSPWKADQMIRGIRKQNFKGRSANKKGTPRNP